jgi:hypothetical protein
MVDSGLITSVLSSSHSIETKAKALIDAANVAGGKDNVTAVIVQNEKQRLRQKVTKPKSEKKNDIVQIAGNPTVPASPPIESSLITANTGIKSRYIIILLSVVSAVLLTILLWQWLAKDKKDDNVNAVSLPEPTKTPQEEKLQGIILNSSGALILDSLSIEALVTITDTVLLQKDSFYFNGNGISLRCDSSFKGPAFFLPSSANYVLLENLDLYDFPIAIIAACNSLHLRNVRFLNCEIPVQYNFLLPQNSYIQGNVTNAVLFRSDSLQANKTTWK